MHCGLLGQELLNELADTFDRATSIAILPTVIHVRASAHNSGHSQLKVTSADAVAKVVNLVLATNDANSVFRHHACLEFIRRREIMGRGKRRTANCNSNAFKKLKSVLNLGLGY